MIAKKLQTFQVIRKHYYIYRQWLATLASLAFDRKVAAFALSIRSYTADHDLLGFRPRFHNLSK